MKGLLADLVKMEMHVYANDGTHMSFHEFSVWTANIKRKFSVEFPQSTAHKKFAEEKKLHENEILMRIPIGERKSLYKQPNVLHLHLEYEKATKEYETHHSQPEMLNKKGRPFKYDPIHYDELKKKLTDVSDVCGFGPALVQSLAGVLMEEKSPNDREDIPDPSIQWARWFLKEQMGFSKRRVTSHKYSDEDCELQDYLHKCNLDHLAIMITEGLEEEFIFCCDEVGVHMQPEEVERWVPTGATSVPSKLNGDKRQFTANIFANAAGEVIAHHQIFAGRSDQSLPNLGKTARTPLAYFICTCTLFSVQHSITFYFFMTGVREKYEKLGFFFSVSDNHWNNQILKLKELDRIHQWKYARYLK